MTSWLTSLLSLIVAALLGGLATHFFERQRWQRSRQDKFDEARRQAIEAALTWLDPITSAVGGAESCAFQLLSGTKDEQQFRQSYPRLLTQLAKLDIPPHQRLLLPSGTYEAGILIERALDNFKSDALTLWEKTRYPMNAPSLNVSDARGQCQEKILVLREQVHSMRLRLAVEYRRTYIEVAAGEYE